MTPTILIVDDSQTGRALVERALVDAGGIDASFLHAEDGAEALELLESHNVDLVLCDVLMPGVDGYEFLALKGSEPRFEEIPTIMLSGQSDVEDKVRCLESGAKDYVVKPFNDAELVARVGVHLELKRYRDQLEGKNRELERRTRLDPLTGIPNRAHLMETLDQELARASRHEAPLGLIMADLDHFKRVNDRKGHWAGDAVLLAVARCLKEAIRGHDTVGRYGGEEFALVIAHADIRGARETAERCRELIAATRIPFEGEELRVTISAGVACFPHHPAKSGADLLQLADQALYAAKAAGRNRVVVAES